MIPEWMLLYWGVGKLMVGLFILPLVVGLVLRRGESRTDQEEYFERLKDARSKYKKELSDASLIASNCTLHLCRFGIGFGAMSTLVFGIGMDLLLIPTRTQTLYDLVITSVLLVSFLVLSYGFGTVALALIFTWSSWVTIALISPHVVLGNLRSNFKCNYSKISIAYTKFKNIDWRKSWDEDTLVMKGDTHES